MIPAVIRTLGRATNAILPNALLATAGQHQPTAKIVTGFLSIGFGTLCVVKGGYGIPVRRILSNLFGRAQEASVRPPAGNGKLALGGAVMIVGGTGLVCSGLYDLMNLWEISNFFQAVEKCPASKQFSDEAHAYGPLPVIFTRSEKSSNDMEHRLILLAESRNSTEKLSDYLGALSRFQKESHMVSLREQVSAGNVTLPAYNEAIARNGVECMNGLHQVFQSCMKSNGWPPEVEPEHLRVFFAARQEKPFTYEEFRDLQSAHPSPHTTAALGVTWTKLTQGWNQPANETA